MTERCENCDNPEAESYDLLVQSDTTEVYLCDECHTGLDQEFIWTD